MPSTSCSAKTSQKSLQSDVDRKYVITSSMLHERTLDDRPANVCEFGRGLMLNSKIIEGHKFKLVDDHYRTRCS